LNSDKNENLDGGDEKELDPVKAAKIAIARTKLLENLDSGNFRQTITKVAHILNIYPNSRNRDITLALRYWETYRICGNLRGQSCWNLRGNLRG
jgi:hypothetical protein